MKRVLMIFALTVAATSAFGADLREFNKAKYGREFLTKGQEEQYRKSQQVQRPQTVRHQSDDCERDCCAKCC